MVLCVTYGSCRSDIRWAAVVVESIGCDGNSYPASIQRLGVVLVAGAVDEDDVQDADQDEHEDVQADDCANPRGGQ